MDHASQPTRAYRFLGRCYEPELRQLVGPTGKTRLKPLLDRLLRCLLDASGNVLSRDELIERVWTRREVNDEVLSRAIAELRALLGDDAREPRFIETLSKGGYRWIAPVTRTAEDPQREQPSPGPHDPAAPYAAAPAHRMLAAGFAASVVIVGLATWLYPRRADEGRAPRVPIAVALLAARPLATDPRLESDARFDSLGRVVYVRAEADAAASELVMVDPASLAERVLWRDEGGLRHPAPSPDGSEVALARHADGGCEVWSVALVDLHRTRLADCAPAVAGGLEWTRDGSALIYSGVATHAGHEAGLVLLDRRSGEQRTLTTPTVGEGAHADPRLSPDGKWLVYAGKRIGEGQLWQTDWPRLQRRMPLLVRADPMYGHAFEPGGGALWIAGDLTRYRALHRLVQGAEPELVGGRGARSIDLSATGAAVWSEAIYDADIWLRDGDGEPWDAVARSSRYESQPEFSADGQRLALVSNRAGSESVFVLDRRDGSVRALPLDPQLRWVRPTWSQRDDALIMTAYANKHTRLYRFQSGDVMPRIVPNVGDGAFHGTELEDRLLFMTGNGSGRGQLMQLRKGEAHAGDVGLGTITAYRASRGWLVWRNEASTTLRAAPWPSLQPVREVATDDGSEALALSGDTLHFLDQGALWSLRLPDGVPARVATDRVPNGNGPSLAASTDGTLAIVTLASVGMDLMFADMQGAFPAQATAERAPR